MTAVEATTLAPASHLKGWDRIELWVGNARAMAGFLTAAFGFHVSAYAGPETGVPTVVVPPRTRRHPASSSRPG